MKIHLINGWQKCYRFYSMYFFALLATAGDLYNLAVQFNLFENGSAPDALCRALNVIGFLGAAARIVQQKANTETAANPPAAEVQPAPVEPIAQTLKEAEQKEQS
jgi:hypothetical protein